MARQAVLISLIIVFVVTGIIEHAAAAAQEPPEAYRDRAFGKIAVAMELVGQARNLLKGGQGRETVKAAMQLYANAGQLFEEALAIFQAMGPDHIDEKDLEGCAQAMRDCLNAINNCKEILKK